MILLVISRFSPKGLLTNRALRIQQKDAFLFQNLLIILARHGMI
jgi:hypothetical protein